MLSWLRTSTVDSPKSDETVKLETVALTYVRWKARYGQYNCDVRECVEAFPNPEDAEKFAESLRAAFKLVRHTSGDNVTVSAHQ